MYLFLLVYYLLKIFLIIYSNVNNYYDNYFNILSNGYLNCLSKNRLIRLTINLYFLNMIIK